MVCYEYCNKSQSSVKGRIFVIISANISSLRQAEVRVLVRGGQDKFCCVHVRSFQSFVQFL